MDSFILLITVAILLFSIFGLLLHYKNKNKMEKELNHKLSWAEYTKRNKVEQLKKKQLQKEKELVKEKKISEARARRVERSQTQPGGKPIVKDKTMNTDYPNGTPLEIIEAYERQSFDEMRRFLQQVAYGMVGKGVSQEDKDEFKKIMTFFANRDPLYKEMIVKLIPIIAKQEGILQSKIYPYLPEYDTEVIRYVLYFAHELGDVKRVKKGRSYELYTSTYMKNDFLELKN